MLSRMRAKGIATITIGTSLGTSEMGIAFVDAEPDLWATVGLHPEHLTSSFEDEAEGVVAESTLDGERLRCLARSSSKVVAIGETGLDFYRIDEGISKERAAQLQETAFREHLLVAHECGLPVVIHCREALTRLAEILQGEGQAGRKARGIVHSFTGTWEEAKPLIDLGCFIAVNGIATFPLRKSQLPEQAIDRTIERIPFERLLLETDAPILLPSRTVGSGMNRRMWKKWRNMSLRCASIIDEVAHQTTLNAMEAFRLPISPG